MRNSALFQYRRAVAAREYFKCKAAVARNSFARNETVGGSATGMATMVAVVTALAGGSGGSGGVGGVAIFF
jgi:hypothetical protein